MRIIDLLKKESVKLNAAPQNGAETVDMLVGLLENSGNISDTQGFKNAVLAREEKSSTSVGEGVAIPHARNAAVNKLSLAAMTVPNGVDYKALDNVPAKLFIMIAVPENCGSVYNEVLSRLMTFFVDEYFREDLISAKSEDEFLKIIDDMERLTYPDEISEEAFEDIPGDGDKKVRLVTVISPRLKETDINDVSQALSNAADKLGADFVLGIDGSDGITDENIENSDGIIVLSDKKTDMSRFDGKRVLTAKISDLEKDPEKLITQSFEAPIYHYSVKKSKGKNPVKAFFGHLINGIVNTLPFIIAGLVFILIAHIINKTSDEPLGTACMFFTWVASAAITFILPTLAGYISKSIAKRSGFFVGLIGGFFAENIFSLAGSLGIYGLILALIAGYLSGYFMLGMEKLCDKIKLPEKIRTFLICPVIGFGVIAAAMWGLIMLVRTFD